MTINSERNNDALSLAVIGRLDTTTAPQLEEALNALSGEEPVVLDMKELVYISSAGLRVLLGAHKRFKKNGFKVTNVCDDVMEVFEMTGFVDMLVIE